MYAEYTPRYIQASIEEANCTTCGSNTSEGLQDIETQEIEPFCLKHLVEHMFFDNAADREHKVKEVIENGISSGT